MPILERRCFFNSHFYFFTKINGTEFSAKTVEQVEKYMEGQVADYELTLEEIDGGTEVIDGTDIDLEYVKGDELNKLLKEQNPLLWITALWDHPEITAPVGVEFDESKLTEVLNNLTCMDPEEQVKLRVGPAGIRKYRICDSAGKWWDQKLIQRSLRKL